MEDTRKEVRKMKIQGKTKLETMSYWTIIASAVLLILGILLGSFVQGTVYLASFGALLLMVGICIYIVSQLIEKTEEAD